MRGLMGLMGFMGLVGFVGMMGLVGCEREGFVTDDGGVKLEFSADTLAFDTVFTTIGTTTRMVTVYNRSRENLRLSTVTLAGGAASRFRMNVDGDTSLTVRDIEIEAGDSIFIFVQANINPSDATTPFLVEDAIVFGNGQRLVLTAWGRNAVYHRLLPTDSTWFSVIDCEHWDHTRPHVFIDPAAVLDGHTLTLRDGDELYFADNAMLVIDSNAHLRAQGTQETPVLFTSLRGDGWYEFLPGQWLLIWFYNYSTGNLIDHAVIENGTGGLRCYPGSQLTVSNTVIRNMSDCGIVGQGATITGRNLLVYDCLCDFTSLMGGSYDFRNCTFANYWSYSARQIESVVLSNNMIVDGTAVGGDLLKADFRDCIVWGTYNKEVLLSELEGYAMNYNLDLHSIVKGGPWSEDPKFTDPREDDYTLQEDSPAMGMGYQWPVGGERAFRGFKGLRGFREL